MQTAETLERTPSPPETSVEVRPELQEIRKKLADQATAHVPSLHIPARFEARARFEALDWIAKSPAGKKAIDYCRKFAGDPKGTKSPLLMGKSGCGKTHLVYAVARRIRDLVAEQVEHVRARAEAEYIEMLNAGKRVQEADAEIKTPWPEVKLQITSGSDIAHDLRGAVQGGHVESVACRFLQEPDPLAIARIRGEVDTSLKILFIDDIEVLKMTDWLHAEVYRIIDKRYSECLPTFMVSNLSIEELRQHLGDRIARRIKDMTEPLEID